MTDDISQQLLLTVQEAARFLHVHSSTVYRLIHGKAIPYVRKPRIGLRLFPDKLAAWMDEDSQVPVSLPPPVLTSSELGCRVKAGGGLSEMAKAKSKTRINFGYGAVYQRKTKDGRIRWYLDYRDGSGKRIQRIASNAITGDEAGLALQKEIRRAFDREYSITRERDKTSFADFAQVYLENYAKVKKRSWRRSDMSYLKAHLIPWFGKMFLSEIKQFQVEQYIAKRLHSRVERRLNDVVKKSTINRELACLRKILAKAVDWGYLIKNPMNGLKLFSEKDNLKERILSREEEIRLLEASSGHLKSILIFALNTGMRRGEILNLKWNQIDLESRKIRVDMTKSDRIRFVSINTDLFQELLVLKNNNHLSAHVFANPETGQPFKDVKNAFYSACKRAQIGQLRFHDLRHTFASRLVENGVDLITVKELLGHSTVKTTERYTHVNQEQKRKAVESLASKKLQGAYQEWENLLRPCDTDSRKSEKSPRSPLFSVN